VANETRPVARPGRRIEGPPPHEGDYLLSIDDCVVAPFAQASAAAWRGFFTFPFL
jgi:hypothetical protein